MKAIAFRERTGTISKPIGLDDRKFNFDIPVFKDATEFVSLYRVSILERLKLLFTGKIWCHVFSGTVKTQPPVYLSTRYPFVITKPNVSKGGINPPPDSPRPESPIPDKKEK